MTAPLRILYIKASPSGNSLTSKQVAGHCVPHKLRTVSPEKSYTALEQGAFDLILAAWEPGNTVQSRVRIICPGIPLIFIGDRPGETAVIEALTGGAADFVLLDNLSRLAPSIKKAVEKSARRRVRIRHRAETRAILRHNENLLKLFVEHAPASLAMFDRDMRYLHASRRWLREYGLKDSDLRGLSHYEVFPEIPDRWKDIHRRALAGETLSAEADRFVRADGTVHWLHWEVRPWRELSGKIAGIVIFSEDITERKEAEERLRLAHDELEQRIQKRTEELARTITTLQEEVLEREETQKSLQIEMQNRMRAVEKLQESERLLIHQSRQAAMGEMIGNIAHQWRQPLNTLGLLIQGLHLSHEFGDFNKGTLDSTVSRCMQLIQHMSETIDDFRNFFKPSKERVFFSLADNIHKTISLVLHSFANKGIRISHIFSTDSTICGYPNELSQALLNIVNNARDVFEERDVQNPLLEIGISDEKGTAVVTITDNAGGIPDEIMEKLFDPYFTTKGPLGTGVGLFMSKVIVEKNMNGRLSACNTETGARFILELPAQQTLPSPPTSRPTCLAHPSSPAIVKS